jgi:hypothetical protein
MTACLCFLFTANRFIKFSKNEPVIARKYAVGVLTKQSIHNEASLS